MKLLLIFLAVACGFAGSLSAQGFQVLYAFTGADNPVPWGKLVLITNTLYGTTLGGGTSGWGSVYALNTNGTEYRVVKNFAVPALNASAVYTNFGGAEPFGGLVWDDGLLYGTTYEGGSGGLGTVYAVTPGGTNFAVLNNFDGTNGKAPYVGLLRSGTTLYGATAAGGASNKGAIFQINTNGLGFNLLESFNITNGLLPMGGLALSGSNLFGTTYEGGVSNSGTIFCIGTNGSGFSVLKSFNASAGSGTEPHSGLVLAGNALYGTTDGDGTLSNSLIYKINTDGTGYTVIKRFSPLDPAAGTNTDGSYVRAGLTLWNGVFYGVAQWGGDFGSGVVFKVNPDGTGYAVLKHFPDANSNGSTFTNSDGYLPLSDLLAANGVLYGTTENGGSSGLGVVYSLAIPPTPSLHAANSGGQAVLFWVDDGLNRTLEMASDLAAGNWTNVPALNWTNAAVNPELIGYRIPGGTNQAGAYFWLK